jgi:hypothetical protein
LISINRAGGTELQEHEDVNVNNTWNWMTWSCFFSENKWSKPNIYNLDILTGLLKIVSGQTKYHYSYSDLITALEYKDWCTLYSNLYSIHSDSWISEANLNQLL